MADKTTSTFAGVAARTGDIIWYHGDFDSLFVAIVHAVSATGVTDICVFLPGDQSNDIPSNWIPIANTGSDIPYDSSATSTADLAYGKWMRRGSTAPIPAYYQLPITALDVAGLDPGNPTISFPLPFPAIGAWLSGMSVSFSEFVSTDGPAGLDVTICPRGVGEVSSWNHRVSNDGLTAPWFTTSGADSGIGQEIDGTTATVTFDSPVSALSTYTVGNMIVTIFYWYNT